MLSIDKRPMTGDLVQIKLPKGVVKPHAACSLALDGGACAHLHELDEHNKFHTVKNAVWIRRLTKDEYHSLVEGLQKWNRDTPHYHPDDDNEFEHFFYHDGEDGVSWESWSVVYHNGHKLLVSDPFSFVHDTIDAVYKNVPDPPVQALLDIAKPDDRLFDHIIYGMQQLGISFGCLEGVISCHNDEREAA